MAQGDDRQGGYRYRHSGLTVASDIEIPEWAAFTCKADGEPQVAIRVVETLPEGGETRFCVENVGAYLVRGGSEIFVAPAAAAPEAHWRLFLLGSAWGALGYQRGLAMWHGSVVARGGRAILLGGDSGEGKSTLAAALVDRGAALVSDDLSRVDPAAGSARVHPSGTRLKLWGEAVERLGWRERVTTRDWLREDKFHCAVPENLAQAPPLALAAIVVLGAGEVPALERLTGAEALEAVLQATLYRPATIEALGAWPQQGALAARILSAVPAFRLARPRDLDRLSASAALIEGLWDR